MQVIDSELLFITCMHHGKLQVKQIFMKLIKPIKYF